MRFASYLMYTYGSPGCCSPSPKAAPFLSLTVEAVRVIFLPVLSLGYDVRPIYIRRAPFYSGHYNFTDASPFIVLLALDMGHAGS